jgi:hypothetical protein
MRFTGLLAFGIRSASQATTIPRQSQKRCKRDGNSQAEYRRSLFPYVIRAPTLRCLGDRDGGRAGAATVRLRRDNLVVERAQIQAVALPRVEVVRRRDRAARALVLAHADVLPEGRGAAHDGRLVDLLVLVDVVGRAVRGDRANEGAADVVRVVLLDVVL